MRRWLESLLPEKRVSNLTDWHLSSDIMRNFQPALPSINLLHLLTPLPLSCSIQWVRILFIWKVNSTKSQPSLNVNSSSDEWEKELETRRFPLSFLVGKNSLSRFVLSALFVSLHEVQLCGFLRIYTRRSPSLSTFVSWAAFGGMKMRGKFSLPLRKNFVALWSYGEQ